MSVCATSISTPGIDVDISGDITDPDFRDGLRDIGARSILCSNLLEHVRGPEQVCAALEELLPPGGLLFISVPHEFPYHPDPIDTMFRPDVEQLLRLFPGSECVRAESIAGGTSWDLAAGGLMTVARKGVQRLVTQTRVQTSSGGGVAAQGALTYIPWLFRPFRVTCAVSAEDRLTDIRRAAPRWFVPALVACLLTWQAVDAMQARLTLSVEWAVLDEVAHAALALFVLLWVQPVWGWRPVLVGIAAATLIDIDHVVAARSLLPADMMSLYARPLLHSVLGVLVIANLSAAFGGWRVAVAASIGAITHIARDAIAEPGVPLLVPFSNEWHMILPMWTLPSTLVLLGTVALGLRACDSADKSRERARGGAPNAHLDDVVTRRHPA